MIRLFNVLLLATCCACGGTALTADRSALVTTTDSLVGTYELGPDTAQGIAGSPGRFGRLRLHRDLTFDVTFAPGGCMMYSAAGSWARTVSGAQLELERGDWLLAPSADVTRQPRQGTLTLAPTDDGVLATGTGLSQRWVLTAAGE